MFKNKSGVATASIILVIAILVGLGGATFYFYTQAQDWERKYQELESDYDNLRSEFDSLESRYNYFINENIIEKTTNIVAVSEDGRGVLATLTVDLTPGNGEVFVKSGPLIGFDFQDAQIDAIKAAANFTNVPVDEEGNGIVNMHTHFKVSAETNEEVTISRIDGPSAGAAAAIATVAALNDEDIRSNVVITGTISSDGSIGLVGGVMEKAEAAEAAGMRLFLVPEGQTVIVDGNRQPISYLKSYASNQGWDLEIREVSELRETTEYFYK